MEHQSTPPLNYIDLTGRTFGRLTVLRRAPSAGKWVTRWLCRCECGTEKIIRGVTLRTGDTTSCGCLHRELLAARATTHGHSRVGKRATTYRVWANMRSRCKNPKTRTFRHYGGRGITVCERWQTFENFLADMGERPVGRELDRIDNDRGYEPDNCRWATKSKNMQNRRNSHFLTLNGETHHLSEWAEILGINPQLIRSRLLRGKTDDQALKSG